MSSKNTTSKTTISDLPDECLRQIFTNIRIRTANPERSFVSLRTVCQRWTPIIDDCWREIKDLTICDGAPHLAIFHFCQHRILVVTGYQSLARKTANGFIEHCGPYLKTLAEQRTLLSTPSIMPLAAQKCHQLEDISVFVLTKTDAGQLRNLLDTCRKLTSLKVDIDAARLYSFFQRIPTHQLTRLTILINNVRDPRLIKYVKATIRHCKVLNKLQIDYMDDELLELLTTLRELHIGSAGRNMMDRYRPLPLMTDEFLFDLSETCPRLMAVTLEQCVNITEDGIAALSSLTELRTLHLLCLPRVTGESLREFAKIEELNVAACDVGDAEISEVLKNCPAVRLLKLDETLITDKTLRVAVQVTKKRTNNITLTLHCANTKTHPKNFRGASPFLKIV